MASHFQHYPTMAKQRIAPDPNVGKNLQHLMELKHKGLSSQPAIAAATGLAQSTIGRILRSEVQPGSENLARIATAMHVPLQALYLPHAQFKERFASGELAGPPSKFVPKGDVLDVLMINRRLSVGRMLQAVGRATRELPAQRKRAIDALAPSPTAEITDGDADFIDDLAGGVTVPVDLAVPGIWETAKSMAANWPKHEVRPYLLDFIERVERAQLEKDQLAEMAAEGRSDPIADRTR